MLTKDELVKIRKKSLNQDLAKKRASLKGLLQPNSAFSNMLRSAAEKGLDEILVSRTRIYSRDNLQPFGQVPSGGSCLPFAPEYGDEATNELMALLASAGLKVSIVSQNELFKHGIARQRPGENYWVSPGISRQSSATPTTYFIRISWSE